MGAPHQNLDRQMNSVVTALTMMPHGTTQAFGASRGGHPGSKPPTGDSHPEVDQLVADYRRALSNTGRRQILQRATVELESWRRKRVTIASEKSLEEIIIEDGQGFDAKMVAERYGLAIGHVARIRQRAGRSAIDGTDPKASNLSREQRRAEAHRMREKGMSGRQIARVLGCDEITVRRDLRACP
jgi:transposase